MPEPLGGAEQAGGAEPATDLLARKINEFVLWVARHWLALFNTVVAVFLLIPFLAPVLMNAGAERLAGVIYAVFAPTCHQLPERSVWLFGPQHVYTLPELEDSGAMDAGLGVLQRQATRFKGNPQIGYKVAICQRDIAIYGSILLNGLLFALLRPRLYRGRTKIPKLPLAIFGLLLLPIVLDGLTQLVGLRESNWVLRLFTGALAGGAAVWLAYPVVHEAMQEVVRDSTARACAPARDGATP
jgi:uncharacterized membrane protein